ncbi:MAG TPA: BrxA/BrxB family bacilliredoxin [Candidatus Acidoferrales bacterium]|nr:BrxA/BrxB family bacilliredoxin [Candidatus Acidoferrales bacterium]
MVGCMSEEVDAAFKREKRTILVVVNSICGCAAGKARPAVAKAVSHSVLPEILATVFAGGRESSANLFRRLHAVFPIRLRSDEREPAFNQ